MDNSKPASTPRQRTPKTSGSLASDKNAKTGPPALPTKKQRGIIGSWFGTTIDNKPWWSAIVVAALGAIGAGLVGATPSVVSWVSSLVSGEKFFVSVVDERTKNGIDGAVVSFWDIDGQKPLALSNSKDDTVKTRNGAAAVKTHANPGAGYQIKIVYETGVKSYQLRKLFDLIADKNYEFTFNPDSWATQDSKLIAVKASIASDIPGDAPAWMKIARGEIGQQERIDTKDNPRITEYFNSTTMGPQPSSVPWNSAFVNWVLTQAGLHGTNSGLAKSWSTWGTATDLRLGCVAIFWRESPTKPTGHVGFFVGDDGDRLRILGGNQHDSVNISAFPKSHLLGCRWPS